MDEDGSVGRRYKTPDGFDAAKQQQVYDAEARLKRPGAAAFPYLIERWHDERYSLTTENGLSGACHNQSVGEVCRTIFFDQLQPYGYWQRSGGDPRRRPLRPSYPDAFLTSADDAKRWWQTNKDKSLLAMQVMVVDWIIAEEAKKPSDFTDGDRAYLAKFRADLIESHKPVTWGNYYSNEREFKVRSSAPTKK